MAVQRWIRYFFVILFFFCIVPVIRISHSVYAASETKIVKVGMYDNKPKVFHDENGVVSGLYPDILNYIAKQEQWQIEYVSGSWEEGLARLEKGDIDIMVDVAVSDERQKKFDFTNQTVMSSWGIIFVQKDSTIDSFQKLDGKKIAILKSSVYSGGPEGVDKYIQTFGLNVEFVYVDQYSEVFELLNKKTVDAAVVSRIFALTNQKNYPNIKQTDMFFNPTELRFALTKGNPENQYRIERLDYWVKKLKDGYDGIYQQSLERHGLTGLTVIGEEIIPSWVRLLGFITATVLFLSWLIIFGLRKTKTIIKQKLEEQEILLSSVIDHTPIIMFALDPQGIITLIEGKALADTGFKQQDIIGKSIHTVFQKNQSFIDGINTSLHGKDIEFKSDLDGKTWRINASPIYKHARVLSVVGVAIDLTEEVRLDKAKTEFLSLASHHLRTLPSAIKWTMELLSPKIEKVLGKEDMKHWKDLEETNTRLIDLANTISRASQLELGRLEVSSELFDLPKLIEEEILAVKPLIQEKKLTVTKQYDGVKDVMFDKNQIRIIVHTLLSNAVRYISPRGLVDIFIIPGEHTFTLKIQDTGWGIPKKQQNKIFTKLFRADNVIKIDVAGLGLGLYMTKIIVEKLGGTIWFESEEGQGSTFYVTLPQKPLVSSS